MTRIFSRFAFAILHACALICMVLLLSKLEWNGGSRGHHFLCQAEACWAEGHEFQAGDYLFDNAVPGSVSIHREGTNSAIGVSVILYSVPSERENPRVIFVRRDEKYFLVELWGVQDRHVVTAEFQHRGGAVSDQQCQVPLTIVEQRDK